ncbi:glycine cleavage system aminomethyltransferase GcvT [Verrucomicrobia bacterium]|nr:glycine cleavage system aminomethyltransferase GcvT [Verrucomicrobiota bacterium]
MVPLPMNAELKRTPLFECHKKLEARIVEFGGWEMPVQYSGIIPEHTAVREAAGLFDISHMGEFFVEGEGAEAFLNYAVSNDVSKLNPGDGQYAHLLLSSGGTVDDLYLYKVSQTRWILIVNASRIDEDWIHFQELLADWSGAKATLTNQSDCMAGIALQGPNSSAFVNSLFTGPSLSGKSVDLPSGLKKNEFAAFAREGSGEIWVSRTGYTGEDGFEFFCNNEDAVALWNATLIGGAEHGIAPCGLGARDTLRTEVCYPLYGHELSNEISPLSAGLGFFVALGKDCDWVGKEALLKEKETGVEKRVMAFKMTTRSAPPRETYPVWSVGDDATQIGHVTSGTRSPSLNEGIGMVLLDVQWAKRDTPIEIEIRGKRFSAMVVRKPLYRKPA